MSLTLSAIAVGAVKCAAAGGCLSVVQYINTSRTLANQNKLAAEGREHSAKLQKLQQEFQEKLQERNFVETERIQREIVALQHEYAKALLDENFSKQWDLIQEQVNLEQAWPLILPAKHYVEQLKMRTLEGRFPLQIIVASSPNASFQLQTTEIGTVLSRTYRNDVFYFDGAWKPGMSAKSAQMLQLQKNLGGCPTIVIKPDIVDGKFIFEMAYWGIADFSSPAPAIITQLSMRDINLNALRQFADEKAAMYEKESAPSPFKELISLREEENNTYDSYIKQHGSDVSNAQENLIAKAQEYCNDLYRTRYQSLSPNFQADIIDIRDKYFYSLIGVATAVMVDVHRMLEYHEKPLGATLASLFNGITEKEWASLMASTYMDVLGSMSEDIFYELPLYYALVASYFNGLPEGKEYAIGFAEAGWKRLHNLYPLGKINDVETHKEAFSILSEVDSPPIFLSNNTTMNIKELNESIEASELKIEKSCKTLSELCSNQSNHYNLEAAREILAESLEETLEALQCVESSELNESDLDEQKNDLTEVIEECRNGRFKIAMIGEYQSGKTTTANAMCGGRYVAPMGSGVKTSAMPVIFSYAENAESESVTVQWKSANEFSVVFEVLTPCVEDFDWSNFDLNNVSHRKSLLEKLESERDNSNVESKLRQFYVLGSMILKWYGSPELEEYKKKSLTFEDVQVLGRFSEDLTSRWMSDGIETFALEESLFPMIRMIECRVCSDLLSAIRCDVIDCPGLFANDYDTAVTRKVMEKSNAILYLLPYHKAISDEGVGDNLIRLKDEYKDIVEKKLFIANNLQFCSSNAAAIERANKGKVRGMFGDGMSFVTYDARLAFIAQLYLSLDHNSISPETEQRFIAYEQQGIKTRIKKREVTDLNSALQRALWPYGLDSATPHDVYDECRMHEFLESLNRFVIRNEAYSVLVTNGIDKLKNNLAKWKNYLLLTHIEPHISGLSNLEALWKKRKANAVAFANNADKKVKDTMASLNNMLVSVLYADVFTSKFYDSLYESIANEIYDIRWKIIWTYCEHPIDAEERKKRVNELVNSKATLILTNKLKERFTYINKLLEDSYGRVGDIVKPAIDNLNATLSNNWSKVFKDDEAFAEKREFYYALPSGLGMASNSVKNSFVDGGDSEGLVDPAGGVISGALNTALALVFGYVLGIIAMNIAVIIVDYIFTGGLGTISSVLVTIGILVVGGCTFKEAFQKAKAKLDEKSRSEFVGKVVSKLKKAKLKDGQLKATNLSEVFEDMNRRALNELVGGLLTGYCSSVRLNKELLDKHAEDALVAAKNGSSVELYNKGLILLSLIDTMLKSFNTCLEKLIELPSVSKKLGS